MKKILVFLFLLFAVTTAVFSQSFNVMTYNIRYDNPSDGKNAWSLRKECLVSQIEKYNPAILGIQEGLHHQVLYLDSCLVNYSYIGVGRDDGKTKGEYCAIFYDTLQFRVIESSTFWLSRTPERVSVGWDAALERICTYAFFENVQTGKRILVFNTHFDHIGIVARKKSAQLIVSKEHEINSEKLPVLIMGDFNSTLETKPIKILKNSFSDSEDISAAKSTGPRSTFHAFDKGMLIDEKIDFILVKNVEVLSVQHINELRPDGFYISDHLPVESVLRIK